MFIGKGIIKEENQERVESWKSREEKISEEDHGQ